MRRMISGLFVVLAATWATGGVVRAEDAPAGDPYPLDTCIVSGKKLGSAGEPVIYSHEGRELRFCSKECVEKFKGDSAAYLKKIDAEIVKQQLPYYPVTTCLVSGETMGGEDGPPVDYVYKNRLVRFCCKECIKKFTAEPAKYLKTLDSAVIQKQLAAYPLKTCVITGEALEGGDETPVNLVIGNRLIRLCCKDCVKKVRKAPLDAFAKIDTAKAGAVPVKGGDDKGAGHGDDHGGHGH